MKKLLSLFALALLATNLCTQGCVPVPSDTHQKEKSPLPKEISDPTGLLKPVFVVENRVVKKSTFDGKVYDENKIPITDAKVTASLDDSVYYMDSNGKYIDEGWVGVEINTINGAYVIRNAPTGFRILITVEKAGYITEKKIVILKQNLAGDPDVNRFDFILKTI